MEIREIDNYADFLSLRERWSNTLSKCDHTVFSTWEWLSIWWKHFGRGKRLLLLLAEEDDEIIGIAPLMYSVHRTYGLRQGRIEFIGTRQLASARFIGTPDSDYNDFIVKKGNEECIKLFIAHLNNLPEKWDCIDLMDIPETSPSLTFLNKTSRHLKPVHKCPYISLPQSHDVFLRSLSSKLRKDIRRNLRRLEREGFKIDFVDCSDAQWAKDGMNSFFELHQKRWKSRGFEGVFEDQRIRDFNLEIAKVFSQNGWLGLYLLKLSDQPVAALYGFQYNSKFYFYLSGFNPRYYRYSVGNLLFSFVVARCIEEGLTELDFMRGAEEYKDRWKTTARWNQRAIIPRKNFFSTLRTLLYEEYWRQGNRLKYVLGIKR